MEATKEDLSVISTGIALAGPVMDTVFALLADDPRGGHIALVALMHAGVRADISIRRTRLSKSEYRAELHKVLDATLDYEERRHEALK